MCDIKKNKAISEQNSTDVKFTYPIDLKLRPIIAGSKCLTYRLSHFVDINLQPLTQHAISYVKDTLRKLPTKMEDGVKVAAYDVENFYENIQHETGLEAINIYWLTEHQLENSWISNDFILSAIKFILKKHIFIK